MDTTNKVIVIGSPGAGKSTFSKQLSQKTGLPLIHLDMVWHKPNQTHVSREEFDQFLLRCFQDEHWIMDGDYSRTLETRFEHADTVFFLDYSISTCLEGIKQRVGQKRADMPWVADSLDDSLLQSVMSYPNAERERIGKLIERYKADRNIIVFKTRAEAALYLNRL